MSMLSRYDPFREMMSLRNAMDRLFDSAFIGPQNWPQGESWDLALDVSETEDEFVVKASIPGIDPDDLDITYNNNTLTIKGELKAEEESEGTKYHVRERRYGIFSRSITLPMPVKAGEIQANYDAGVLKLRLPKAEEARPKRIAVKTSGNKVIEGKVANIKSKN